MLQAIVHHGFIRETIEYFATVTGPNLDKRFFFEQTQNGGHAKVRYFAGGSEIVLSDDRVEFSGNGGIFGEYMFGGHLPVQDLLNDEVVNRLVLFGTIYDRDRRELSFTNQTSGAETYDDIFFNGNAVSNYFFFIDDRGFTKSTVERQERTLRTIGKLLKRSRKVGRGNFLDLAAEIIEALAEPQSTIFLVRIIHRMHQQFYNASREAYLARRGSLEDITRLIEADLGPDFIDSYQRERIQIDVIYHHKENQDLIDEYKRVLAQSTSRKLTHSERARLMRLRTLSLRNEVPLSIFDMLEEIVLQEEGGAKLPASEEPDFIQSTREILEGFLLGKTISRKLSSSDTLQLMENKQKAAANRDQTFEEILLDTGRLIDESARDDDDFERMESFGELITFFDRFDHTSTLVNKLAFMDDVEFTGEQIRSLLGNMHEFEKLRRGLFQQLFIEPVLANEYTLSFGRRKLYSLMIGLMSIDSNEASLSDVVDEIRQINLQERAYFGLYRVARKRMSSFYLELNTVEGRETFRREIAAEVDRDPDLRPVKQTIDDELLDNVITKIRLEAFYINQMLPKIIDERDSRLRNDFLVNSGLDRFQVEELETEYFDLRNYPPHLLQSIREGLAASEEREDGVVFG
ncbi:MAG: TIGR04442 family protein [Thermoanaerobaculia bacterium]|nr:TIGR04442 family protein [Thermoanaerobaculia bacterium]